MIVFAAIVPHSPLLIHSIGKTHRERIVSTLSALQEFEQALYLSKPDTICIIAPHGSRYPDAFSINLANKYTGNLKAFGDFSTTVDAKGDYLLIDRTQRSLRAENIPFTLTSNEELDYGYAVPLLLLTSHLTNWKLIPVSPSLQDAQQHFEFGKQLKRVLHSESERVAVIASVDLSHALSADSPAGASTEGLAFDQAIISSVETKNADALLSMSPDIIEKAHQCAHRPVVTLLGLLEGMNVAPKKLCYEAPFGVGYLTVKYDIA